MRISKFKKLGVNFKIQKLGVNSPVRILKFKKLGELFEIQKALGENFKIQKLGVNSPVRILKIKIWIFFHFFPQLKCGC